MSVTATETNTLKLSGEAALLDLYAMSTSPHTNKLADTEKPERKWNEGDSCMAPYTDGRWYPAKIVKLMSETCRVNYTEYDEEEDVDIEQLLSEADVQKSEDDDVYAADADTDEDIADKASASIGTILYSKTDVTAQATSDSDAQGAGESTVGTSADAATPVPTMPRVCPPTPAALAKADKPTSEKDSIDSMLMSWYMSGYHTGYYEGLKKGRQAHSAL